MPSRFFIAFLSMTGIVFAQTPEEILSTFEIHPDFELQLVAREPIVVDPVDLEFDENGQPYVLEFPGYPNPENANGSIIAIEDTDGDGVYDVRTVFADGFPVATSILPWRGGLLVASPPHLLFVRDSDGDGRADVEDVLMSGFDVGNQQHNYNGLTYGLDNWVYGANGGNQGKPFWPEDPDATMPLHNDDFRFDLDSRTMERIGRSTGGFGLAFDTYGRLFETHNTVHVSHLVFHGRYLDGVPAGRGGSLDWDIADHSEGSTARIYAIGEQETRVNHPEQSGYFSGACGVTYYGGGAFGEAFDGNLFVCDVVLNLIHRDVLVPNGASFEVSRAQEGVEFLASRDRAFRPVNLSVGPDGAMYVMDMHRDVIEHPEWIPDEIEVNLDLEAGKDKGRIFRIVPKSGLKAASVSFSKDDIDGAVRALTSPNKWWRDNGQRLLVEWEAESAVPALRTLLKDDAPHARLHALWTLHHLGELDDDELRVALTDAEAGVRENAVHIAATRAEKSRKIRSALEALAGDESARVRMATALTLGEALGKDAGKNKGLIAIAGSDAADPWTRLALASAFEESPIQAIEAILSASNEVAGTSELASSLSQIAVRDSDARDISTLLADLSGWAPSVQSAVLDGIAAGLGLRDEKLAADDLSNKARETLAALVDSEDTSIASVSWRVAGTLGLARTEAQIARIAGAIEVAGDSSNELNTRWDALRIAGFAPLEDREALLFALIDPREPVPLQTTAMEQLRGANSKEVAARLIDMWQTLGPEARAIAANILLYQRHNHDQLLTALEDGRIALGQMNFDLERRRTLLHWSSDDIGARAAALFTDAGVVTRKAALDKMRPAIKLAGDSARGAAVFAERCAKCHMIGGQGGEVGPSLDDIYRKSKETLLHDILDPNAGVETEYLSYTIELKSDDDLVGGEIITGMIVDQNTESITLRAAEQEDRVIPRSHMKSMRGSGLSMMPEELEAGLEPQDVADLLAFLQEVR